MVRVKGTFFRSIAILAFLVLRVQAEGAKTFVDESFHPAFGGSVPERIRAWVDLEGRVIVSGDICMAGGRLWPTLARLKLDGSLDDTFRPNWRWPVDAISFQQDGQMIIASGFRIRRISPSGKVDESFVAETPGRVDVVSMASISDGSVAVVPRGKVPVWLDASGRLSATRWLRIDFSPTALAKAPNENIVMIGADGNSLVRVLNDGWVDNQFVSPTFDGAITALAVQSDGKILVGGRFGKVGNVWRNKIARLNENGSLDETFNPGGLLESEYFVSSIEALKKGGVFVSALYEYPYTTTAAEQFVAHRLFDDGSKDESFKAADMRAHSESGTGCVVLPDGKVVVAGGVFFIGTGFNDHGTRIARLNADGSEDESFQPGLTGPSYVSAIAVRRAGGVLVNEGRFDHYGFYSGRVRTLRQDGADDPSFTAVEVGPVYGFIEQADDKVIAWGRFDEVNEVSVPGLARFHADGRFDESFKPEPGINLVNAMTQLKSGKLLVAARWELIRLNSDGTRDHRLDGGATSSVTDLLEQRSGKIIVAGSLGDGGLLRMHAEGGIDTDFKYKMGDSTVFQIRELSSGKMMAAGFFKGGVIPTNQIGGVIRIEENGELDTSFKVPIIRGGVCLACARFSNSAEWANDNCRGFCEH